MKNKILQKITAIAVCAVLALPAAINAADENQWLGGADSSQETSAAAETEETEEAEGDFVIEDGVLTEYSGDAADLTIPEGVTGIADDAFSGCSLTSVTIPASVAEIGDDVFFECSDLTAINVAEGNAVYASADGILYNKAKTELIFCPIGKTGSAAIPAGVTGIKARAFMGCSLTEVTIPEGVTSIGNMAFSGCGLTSVTIPKGVKELGGELFSASALKNVTISEGVASIPYMMFAHCEDLASVTISEGVTEIGDYAFEDCGSLTSIVIPEGVTSIGVDAFYSCSSLTSIVIPESVTSIGVYEGEVWNVFDGCDKLTISAPAGSYAQKYASECGIPFKVLEEKPSETPSQIPEDAKVVPLTAEKTAVSKTEMDNLIADNKDHAVVIELANSIRFTFAKGTMKAVDGKNSYDFGAKVSSDYSGLKNPPIAKDEFVQAISYSYSGNLPAEASISIPVGTKWAGKKLYYYEVTADGTYKYVDSDTVGKDGFLTVQQSHCSDYVITTKAIAESPKTGDSNAAVFWCMLLLFAAGSLCAAGGLTAAGKKNRRF